MDTQVHADEWHYSVEIHWDPRHKIYVATVLELLGAVAHGETYEEALANVKKAIESWVAGEDPAHLPAPRVNM
jgi:predicted RNase H-like HicB family nuclease